MEQITPKQAITNAIIACRVEALRARARGTHTIADEWDGHASTIRDLKARLAPVEQPEVAELLARAEELERDARIPGNEFATRACDWAADLRAHVAALVKLAEAQAKLAEAEKRKVPEGWEPFSIHEQRGGVVDLFFGCGEDGHTAEWLYSLSDDGAYFCTGIPDRSKWNDAIRVARERGGVELTGSGTGVPRGAAEEADHAAEDR